MSPLPVGGPQIGQPQTPAEYPLQPGFAGFAFTVTPPRPANESGVLQTEQDWKLLPIKVERRVTLGSGAVVMGGTRIGAGALVGAGAVVTRDVAPGATVLGVPARQRSGPPNLV